MNRHEGKLLAWVFAAIIVVGVAVYLGAGWRAEREADQVYENALAACHRANPRWKAYTDVVQAATQSSSDVVRVESRAGLKLIREQPYVRKDGTTECERANQAP